MVLRKSTKYTKEKEAVRAKTAQPEIKVKGKVTQKYKPKEEVILDYWKSTKVTYSDATKNATKNAKTWSGYKTGLKHSDGTDVVGNSKIEFTAGFLSNEGTWQVTVSQSLDEDGRYIKDMGEEMTLVSEDNGWNFKINANTTGPFNLVGCRNIIKKK